MSQWFERKEKSQNLRPRVPRPSCQRSKFWRPPVFTRWKMKCLKTLYKENMFLDKFLENMSRNAPWPVSTSVKIPCPLPMWVKNPRKFHLESKKLPVKNYFLGISLTLFSVRTLLPEVSASSQIIIFHLICTRVQQSTFDIWEKPIIHHSIFFHTLRWIHKYKCKMGGGQHK